MMAFPDPSFKPETPASHEAVWDSVLNPGKGPFRGAQYKVLSTQVRNIKLYTNIPVSPPPESLSIFLYTSLIT